MSWLRTWQQIDMVNRRGRRCALTLGAYRCVRELQVVLLREDRLELGVAGHLSFEDRRVEHRVLLRRSTRLADGDAVLRLRLGRQPLLLLERVVRRLADVTRCTFREQRPPERVVADVAEQLLLVEPPLLVGQPRLHPRLQVCGRP